MAIYEYSNDKLSEVSESAFSILGIRERDDLQRLLRDQVEIVAPDCLVIGEEFGEWDESSRRIDLLAIDQEANLVVIELKRTEKGGHMELQSVRYAAMVSTMTFEQAVNVFEKYLAKRKIEEDAESTILNFLGWDTGNDEDFASDVRIVLVSANFSVELTGAVLWLTQRDIDIRCIRIQPYQREGQVLLDVQQIIPLPEAEEFQVRIKEKQKRERKKTSYNSDYTKYEVTIDGQTHERLAKRHTIFTVVQYLHRNGVAPMDMAVAIPGRRNRLFFRRFLNLDNSL